MNRKATIKLLLITFILITSKLANAIETISIEVNLEEEWLKSEDPADLTLDLAGYNITANLGDALYIVIPTSNLGPTGTTLLWSDPINWDMGYTLALGVQRELIIYDLFVSPANIIQVGLGESFPVEKPLLDLFEVPQGPTKLDLKVPIGVPVIGAVIDGFLYSLGFPDIDVAVRIPVNFDVTIDGGRSVLLDQNSQLAGLLIGSGSDLEIQEGRTLIIDNVLENHGFIAVNTSEIIGNISNQGTIVLQPASNLTLDDDGLLETNGDGSVFYILPGASVRNGTLMCINQGELSITNEAGSANRIDSKITIEDSSFMNVTQVEDAGEDSGVTLTREITNNGIVNIDSRLQSGTYTTTSAINNNLINISENGKWDTLGYVSLTDGSIVNVDGKWQSYGQIDTSSGSTVNIAPGGHFNSGKGLTGTGTVYFEKGQETALMSGTVLGSPNLTGTGILDLDMQGQVVIDDSSDDFLIQGAIGENGSYTITDGRVRIQGMDASLTNEGTITAKGTTLEIGPSGRILGTTGTVQAISRGTLQITNEAGSANRIDSKITIEDSSFMNVTQVEDAGEDSGFTSTREITNNGIVNIDSRLQSGTYTTTSAINNNLINISENGKWDTLGYVSLTDGSIVNVDGKWQSYGQIDTSSGSTVNIAPGGHFNSGKGLTGTGTVYFEKGQETALMSGTVLGSPNLTGTGILDLDMQGQVVIDDSSDDFLIQGAIGENGSYTITDGRVRIQGMDASLTNEGTITAKGTTLEIGPSGRILGTTGTVQAISRGTLQITNEAGSANRIDSKITIEDSSFMNVTQVEDAGEDSGFTSTREITNNGIVNIDSRLQSGTYTTTSAINNNLINISENGKWDTLGYVSLTDGSIVNVDGKWQSYGQIDTSSGSTVNINHGGNFSATGEITGNGTILNEGTTTINTPSEIGYIYNSGLMALNSTIDFDELTLDGGIINSTNSDFAIDYDDLLTGNGTINGNVYNDGIISPGFSPGLLEINGDLTLDSQSVLEMEIYGNMTGEYDRINVTGNLTLGGTLAVVIGGTAVFYAGSEFDLFTASSYSNSFSNIILPVTPFGDMYFSYQWLDNSLHLTSLQSYNMENNIVPLPSSVLLGSLGLVLAAQKLKRRKEY